MAVVAWAVFSVVLPASIGRRWLCYINPFARALDFTLGMIIALQSEHLECWTERLKGPVVTILEVATLALVALSLVWTPWFPGRFIPRQYWYPVIGFLVCIFASECRGAVSLLFNWQPLVRLGGMSLGIYMFQANCIRLSHGIAAWPNLPALLFIFAILLLISWLYETYLALRAAKWFTACGDRLLGR